ncbi:MAG TPA: outer membrane protein assembly factor BamC [Burkholderiales bacterium]|nr:outer membrane protein assembly factor BamC [Burkholderiales bacterium]
MKMVLLRIAALAAGAALAACSGFNLELPTKKVEYKSQGSKQIERLEVPPDLTRPTGDDRFVVPGGGSAGSATFSEYQKDRQGRGADPSAGPGILPVQNNARVERAGTQRWLVVNGEPEKLWPHVKEFWQELGFLVNIEIPEAGVMETDWAENRARIPDGMIRNFLGRVLDQVYSTSERDKFRTRLERGAQPGTTEIYISHRGMEEVYTGLASGTADGDQTRWQPRPPSPELEAEMLRRMMVRLGVQEERAKTQITRATPAAPRATLRKGGDGAGLMLEEQFDRAWRRVGLALDRVGFTVEDRDRSKGIYFVRYIDPGIDNRSADNRGWLSRFKFWGSDDRQKAEQYRVVVKDMGDRAEVNVLSKEGARDQSATASRILTLLHEQLR